MEPRAVKAIFTYTGQHTDELIFKKGDIITLTQPADGGWYEGTLKGVTGWFPANYVIEYHGKLESPQGIDEYRETVVTNLIDTEAVFVHELDSFMNSSLQPIWRLFGEDYDSINRHLEMVREAHRTLLSALRSEAQKDQPKVGKIFLTVYPRLQSVHSTYASHHPKYIKLIMNAANVNSQTPNNNGALNTLDLSVGLSSPFRRIEKYETLLDELTRHTPENHVDRGDCQRSFRLYMELAQKLGSIRKQKDVETEILSASIRNWDGPPISALGEIRHTCPVVGFWQNGRKDHFMCVLDTCIVLISLYNSNEFQLDCKFPLDRTTVTTIDKPMSLEILHSNTKVLVTFHNLEDFEKVRGRVDVYSTVQKRNSSPGSRKSKDSIILKSNGSRPGTPEVKLECLGSIQPINHTKKNSWFKFGGDSKGSSRPTSPAPPLPAMTKSLHQKAVVNSMPSAVRSSLNTSRFWAVLPHSRIKVPLQKEPTPGLKRGSSARKNKKELPLPILPPEEPPFNQQDYERDLNILKIVESYAGLEHRMNPGGNKKPNFPITGSIQASVIPNVRVSTTTVHSGSPMAMSVEPDFGGGVRPMSVSPVTIGGTGDAMRTLQNDVLLLKDQMAKVQLELQEERKQRKALQDQVALLAITSKRL